MGICLILPSAIINAINFELQSCIRKWQCSIVLLLTSLLLNKRYSSLTCFSKLMVG
jgi:hypothetical protein